MTKRADEVSEAYLAEGALLALDQAGRLLVDAQILYKASRYATAMALALFGREELGRSRILYQLCQRVRNGDPVTASDVQKACDDHLEKQRQSLLGGIVLRATPSDAIGRAIQTKLSARPQSQEYTKASETIDLAVERKMAQLPGARHADRLEALYVDPTPSAAGWNRPSTLAPERARLAIEDLSNDYADGYWQARNEPSAHVELVAGLPEPFALPPPGV
jgi:AbiV family abortive infection protein